MSENSFLLPLEEYQRAISPVGDYVKQIALYASKELGKPYEVCLEHFKKKLQDRVIRADDPIVKCFKREENGDNHLTEMSLSAYISDTLKNKEILAPTFTTYLNTDVKRSSIVGYIDEGVAKRSKNKKISQKYEAEGNALLYRYYDQQQSANKIKNNAVSGGFVAAGSVIENRSAHSTLTSTTRTLSSISNMSNERLIEGNRQYFTPDVTLYNILSIVQGSDLSVVNEAVQAYGLSYPSTEDVMFCLKRSTDLYWIDRHQTQRIRNFVDKLSPVEKAAVVYTGDLYHIRVFNEDFTRRFITELSQVGSTEPVEDVINFLYKYDEAAVNYAHQINMSMMRGKGKDYKKLTQDEQYILANTCKSITATIQKYKLFLKAFFLTKNAPCTTATVRTMIRRAVVLSDTDSTMFSADNWVQWYFGKLDFTDKGFAVSGAVMFMATNCMAHIIAQFSANLGVERSKLLKLAMKPEFVFPVFAQTSVAKHYYTAMSVKEGNVYPKIKMEIKGVHMKDSTVPENIIEGAAKRMKSVIETVMSGEKVSLTDVIDEVIGIEEDIVSSVSRGETRYLKRFKIKEASAYKKDAEDSPYQYYTLWNQAFSTVAGQAPKPPYNAVRVPLTCDSRKKFTEWVEKIENPEVKSGLVKWFTENNKSSITSFPIPSENCALNGVPQELRLVLDAKGVALVLTKSYRNILNSLGYFPKDEHLVSELNPERLAIVRMREKENKS